MPTRQAILDNIELYEAEELLEFIHNGIVTFDDLCNETEGCFPRSVRNKLKQMLENDDYDEEYDAETRDTEYLNDIDAWADIDKNNIEELSEFTQRYPQSRYVQEARRLINELFINNMDEDDDIPTEALIAKIEDIKVDRTILDPVGDTVKAIKSALERERITHQELVDIIADDNNLLNAACVKRLIEEGVIDYSDLMAAGIDRRFIKRLGKLPKDQRMPQSRKIDLINKPSYEVYFWGIPSSGKSCALGAILSVAGNGKVALSMQQDNDCQGYGYMNRLAQRFSDTDSVCVLPPGTPVTSTYEMGFDLEDEKHNYHPITCIDLAGELVRCMYKSDAGEQLTDDQEEALETLTNLLVNNRTNNRKMHFFVVEYGGENREYEGLRQEFYLRAALSYINRTKIFKRDTDAIYLMVTKVDKAGCTGNALRQHLFDYIANGKYQGFYQGLQAICRDNEINNGIVEVIPFSLGNVCFENFCLFNPHPAERVVHKLLERTKGFRRDKIGKIGNFLRN